MLQNLILKKARYIVDLTIGIGKVVYREKMPRLEKVINIMFDENLFTSVTIELAKNVNKRLNILLHTI